MKQKKKQALWYTAATHFLTAGFVVPLVGSVLVVFIYAAIANPFLPSIASVIAIVSSLAFIWLGVIYSARFIKGRYILDDPKRLVLLSTYYAIGVAVVFTALDLLFPDPAFPLTTATFVTQLGTDVVYIIAFYLASKKYLLTE